MDPVTIEPVTFRPVDSWTIYGVPKNRPIRYLEIGVFQGANLFNVAETYGTHPQSELHGIDPWRNYEEYNEYRENGTQDRNYRVFMELLNRKTYRDKITVHRGFSNEIVPEFDDGYFDVIYIDGNHHYAAVLEDLVLCYRKLRPGGIMICDDYGWDGESGPKRAIEGFLHVHAHHMTMQFLGMYDSQVFIMKQEVSF